MNIELTKFKELIYPRCRRRGCEYMMIESISWSLNGKYLVATANDCSVHIWNIKTGKRIKVLQGNSKCIHINSYATNYVKWSPQGDTIAIGCEVDKVLKIWNWKDNTITTYDLSKDNFISPVLWSPNGHYLILSFSTKNGIHNKIFDVTKNNSSPH
ncbi:MAG: WD40 repeat domain-containing protein [Candidatus Njordarchaeia archaeon]